MGRKGIDRALAASLFTALVLASCSVGAELKLDLSRFENLGGGIWARITLKEAADHYLLEVAIEANSLCIWMAHEIDGTPDVEATLVTEGGVNVEGINSHQGHPDWSGSATWGYSRTQFRFPKSESMGKPSRLDLRLYEWQSAFNVVTP